MEQKDLIKYGVTAACASVLGYLYYVGMFSSAKVKNGLFPGVQNLLYVEYKSSLKDIGTNIWALIKRIYENKEFTKHEYSWRLWGFYYDDPDSLKDKNNMRYIIGIQVEDLMSRETFDAIV